AIALCEAKWAGASAGQSMMANEEPDFRQLVLEHYDREHLALRKYVLFLGLGAEISEDVVQESFLRLYEHLQRAGDRTNLRAWLYRVAHNLTRNRQTAVTFRKTDALSNLTAAVEPVTNALTPEQVLLNRERDAALHRALKELTPAQRECLGLRAQGLKYREMAGVLQLSVSAVAENVQRGLEKLRKIL
ncbi:MAG: RNA polymerase sigma factor, partial [Acidobacteriota bacterium]|nr:RNA polymerase sigma factor [Acidobacteriota bacterium]